MKSLRIATALVLAATAAACASSPQAGPDPFTADQALMAGQADVAPATGPTPVAPAMAVRDMPETDGQADTVALEAPAPGVDPVAAEDDFNAIYGQDPYNPVADPNLPASVELPASYDPWEGFNRRVHSFNNAIDRTVARPLALAYVDTVPRPVRLGVSNFFSNLGQPISALNALLQGKPAQAGESMGRFLMNSTLGIGGIFDPASDANLANRSEDFGQTLGVWGWRRSRYLELPVFGPRTVRDVFGLLGDAPLSPIRQIGDDPTRVFLQGLQLVDVRVQLLAIDGMMEGAVDEYALYRDSWLQRRNYQIGAGFRDPRQDEGLPDYLLEEEANPTVPANAMPVIIPMPGG